MSDVVVHGLDKAAGPVELVKVMVMKPVALKFFLCFLSLMLKFFLCLLLFGRFFLKLRLFLVLCDGGSQHLNVFIKASRKLGH